MRKLKIIMLLCFIGLCTWGIHRGMYKFNPYGYGHVRLWYYLGTLYIIGLSVLLGNKLNK